VPIVAESASLSPTLHPQLPYNPSAGRARHNQAGQRMTLGASSHGLVWWVFFFFLSLMSRRFSLVNFTFLPAINRLLGCVLSVSSFTFRFSICPVYMAPLSGKSCGRTRPSRAVAAVDAVSRPGQTELHSAVDQEQVTDGALAIGPQLPVV